MPALHCTAWRMEKEEANRKTRFINQRCKYLSDNTFFNPSRKVSMRRGEASGRIASLESC